MPAGFTPVSFTEAAGYGQDEDPTAALVTFNLICERGKADNGTSLDDPSAAAMAYFAHPPPDYVVDGASEYAILLAYGMSDPFMRAALQQWGNPSVKEADLNRAQLASNVEEFSYSIPGAVAGMLTIDGAQSLPTAQPFLVAFDVVASEILGSFEVRFDGMESRAGPSVLNSATPSEGQLVRPGAGALLGGASLTVEFAMREPSPG